MRHVSVLAISLLVLSIFSSAAAQSATAEDCPESQFSEWGMSGVVTPGDSNTVRAEPSTSAEVIGQLAPGDPFNVNYNRIACADGYLWLEITSARLAGWTVEIPIDSDVPFIVPYAPEPRQTGQVAVDDSIRVEENGLTFTVPAGLGITQVTVVPEVGFFGEVMSAQPSSVVFAFLDEAGDERGNIEVFRYAVGSDTYEFDRYEELESLLRAQTSLLKYASYERMPQAPMGGSGALFGGAGAYVPFGSGNGLRFITYFAQTWVMFTPETSFEYVYRGITTDQAYLLAGQGFPVQVPGDAIPVDTGDIIATEQYEPYLRQFEANLATQPMSAFTPDLALLDELFASLTITDNAALSDAIP